VPALGGDSGGPRQYLNSRPRSGSTLPGIITEERHKFPLCEREFVSGYRQGFGKAGIFELCTSAISGVSFLGTYR
jgi:hypothetical protein